MSEGKYPVWASVTYLDVNGNIEEVPSNTETLVVDRVLPTARITYPGPSLRICPVKYFSPNGNWYGIPVEGVVSDNT
jgi:hypothetical protein